MQQFCTVIDGKKPVTYNPTIVYIREANEQMRRLCEMYWEIDRVRSRYFHFTYGAIELHDFLGYGDSEAILALVLEHSYLDLGLDCEKCGQRLIATRSRMELSRGRLIRVLAREDRLLCPDCRVKILNGSGIGPAEHCSNTPPQQAGKNNGHPPGHNMVLGEAGDDDEDQAGTAAAEAALATRLGPDIRDLFGRLLLAGKRAAKHMVLLMVESLQTVYLAAVPARKTLRSRAKIRLSTREVEYVCFLRQLSETGQQSWLTYVLYGLSRRANRPAGELHLSLKEAAPSAAAGPGGEALLSLGLSDTELLCLQYLRQLEAADRQEALSYMVFLISSPLSEAA